MLHDEAQQFWNRDDARRRAWSHWRGYGRWKDPAHWYALGQKNLRRYDCLRDLAGDMRQVRMCEYGCGGGANVVAFAGRFEAIYGVDVSLENLKEADRRAQQCGFVGFEPVLTEVSRPELVLASIPAVDFFLTVSVLQHVPSQAYGLRVVRLAHDLLVPGGTAIFQVRIYEEGDPQRFRPKTKDYERNAMSMTSYGDEQFAEILNDCGLELLLTEYGQQSAVYYVQKPNSDNQ